MSTNIVLPTLSKWTEDHVSAIYTSTSQPDTTNALDNFLSKNVVIKVNGKEISRTDLTKELQTEKFLEAGAIVSFNNVVEVPDDKKDPVKAGSVGTFFTVTIQETIRVRDAPVSHEVTASLNVVIEQDPSIPVPPPSPIHGFFDPRRVKELNLVITDTPIPLGPF